MDEDVLGDLDVDDVTEAVGDEDGSVDADVVLASGEVVDVGVGVLLVLVVPVVPKENGSHSHHIRQFVSITRMSHVHLKKSQDIPLPQTFPSALSTAEATECCAITFPPTTFAY